MLKKGIGLKWNLIQFILPMASIVRFFGFHLFISKWLCCSWNDLFLKLSITVRGVVPRGVLGSNVSKGTQTSKQLDDFLKHRSPRCAKPLL